MCLPICQVVNEKKSRVASCWPYDMVNIKRYTCEMEAAGLGIDKWRKSNLWFTLRRDLAELVSLPPVSCRHFLARPLADHSQQR